MAKPTYEELEDRVRHLEEMMYLNEGCSGKYQGVLEALGDIVYKLNVSGEFVYINDSVRKLGYDPSELIGEHFSAIIHPDDVPRVSRNSVLPTVSGQATGDDRAPKLFDERRSGKRMTRNLEIRLIPKGWAQEPDASKLRIGSAVVLGEVMSSGRYRGPEKSKRRRFVGSTGIVRDITDHKLAERALRESEGKYRDLAKMLPVGVFETDAGGRVLFANRAALTLFGLDGEDVRKGISVLECIEDGDGQGAVQRKLTLGESVEMEFGVRRKDGTSFPALIKTNRIVRDGGTTGMRVVVMDISERKRVEEEQLRREKLEAIRILVGGIAHDFNNILTGITGNISLSKALVPRDSQALEVLEQAERASVQAGALVTQLTRFADTKMTGAEVINLKQVIRDSAEMALRGSPVSCELAIADNLRPAAMSEGEMREIVNNLIINARQAMGEHGTVRAGAQNTLVGPEHALPLAPGKYVKLWVADEGAGIPEANLAKIFDPYFTTKEKGSGLGLAVCYSIVKKHGGHISVASAPGKGTSFTVYVPVSGKQGRGMPAAREERISFGKGRILVMDDEEMIRSTMEKILRYLGYDVASAEDGREAVELYRGARDGKAPFDAVLLDVTVRGGVGGLGVIDELLDMDAGAKIIVMTGHPGHPVLTDFRKYGFVWSVAKPFRIPEMSAVLKRLLARDER